MTGPDNGSEAPDPAHPRRFGPAPYTRHSDGTFHAHLTARPGVLHALRAEVARVLREEGASESSAHDAQLVLSELATNAIQACGDGAPLIVEVRAGPDGVVVSVTDPAPTMLPQTPEKSALDDAAAESGRGLAIVNALSKSVDIDVTAIGKRITCLLAPA